MPVKFSCGSILPSSCVPWQGSKLVFLADDAQPECDANIDDVFNLVSVALKNLQDATNLTDQSIGCLSITAPYTIKKIAQAQTNKICAIDAQLQTVLNTIEGLDIGSELITVNLSCLAASAAPCLVAPNTYSLTSVLNTLVAEICALKVAVGI